MKTIFNNRRRFVYARNQRVRGLVWCPGARIEQVPAGTIEKTLLDFPDADRVLALQFVAYTR